VLSNGAQPIDEVFTNLVQQFQAQCQLECGSSPDGVPDFNAIFKKIKADFVHNSISSTAPKPYSMWLVSRTNKPVTEAPITEPFNLIAGSDTSSWLQSTTASQMDTSSTWLHSSSTVRSEPAEVLNTIAETNMSSWLSPSPTKQSQQEWVTPDVSCPCSTRESVGVSPAEVFNTVAATSPSLWLTPSAVDKPQSSTWMDTADHCSWLHSSNDPGNTKANLWLQQANDHNYTDWLLCNRSSQDDRCK